MFVLFLFFFPCKSKEWPQKHQAALMYLGPTERPPEEPEEKPSRPPLYVRLYRRLRLYWSPPRKGEMCVLWYKVTGSLYLSNSSELWIVLPFFFSLFFFFSLVSVPFSAFPFLCLSLPFSKNYCNFSIDFVKILK